MNIEYENRVVVFIDILGFKNIIKEAEKAIEVASILDNLQNCVAQHGDNHLNIEYHESLEIAYFSDSIVLSCLKGKDHFLLDDLARLQIDLMMKGIFIRGCITIGKLYHKGNYIFGEALIEAYETESKVAKYPRIILGKDYNYEGSYFCKDYDGILFLNPFEFANQMKFKKSINIVDFINKTSEYIETNILKYNNTPEICMKYSWLKQLMSEAFYKTDEGYNYFQLLNSTYNRNKMFKILRDKALSKK